MRLWKDNRDPYEEAPERHGNRLWQRNALMPITADRMLFLIDLAEQSTERNERAGGIMRGVHNNITSLQRRLNELDLQDPVVDELAFSIERAAYDGQLLCQTPASEAQALGAEKKNFMVNQQKHKNAAARMRMLRERRRPGGEEATTTTTSLLPMRFGKPDVRAMMQQDIEENQRIGAERHPEHGACNSDADGQCSWCKRLEAMQHMHMWISPYIIPGENRCSCGYVGYTTGQGLCPNRDNIIDPADVIADLTGLSTDDKELSEYRGYAAEPDLQHEQWLPKRRKEPGA